MTIISIEKKKRRNNFFREIQKELKKVSWTSKEELLLSTKVVIISIFVFGLGIFVTDLSIRSSLDFLNRFVSYFGG